MNFGSRSAVPFLPRRATPLGRLVVANALSSVGDGARLAALPLLAATVTHDVLWVSAVAAAGRAAWLPAPIIGTLVDRVPARRSLVGADLARCAVLTVLCAGVATGRMPVALLMSAAFLCGIAEVFFDSAAQAVVPRLAADQELERANAHIIAAQITGTGFLGPPLGAALWAVGRPWPFAVDALTFLVSALLLRGLTAHAPTGWRERGARAERGVAGLLRGTWSGVRLLAQDRVLRRLMLVVAVLGVGQQAVYAVLVVYVEGRLGLPPWGYGLMLVAAALGSLAGARAAPGTARRLGTARSLVVSLTVSALGYLVVAVVPWWPLVAVMLAVNSAAVVLWNVCTVSLRQRLAPPHMLGRVTSGYRLAAWGTMPVGAALGGVLAGHVGPGAPWAAAGLLLLGCLPLLYRMPSPERSDDPGTEGAAQSAEDEQAPPA
ncbi:MFS transporter [Streptomyces collinus]|uniref:MFS transporter n=1 Tax=Streptomyces collinus TaxID=42684 RepID=UPI0036A76AA8